MKIPRSIAAALAVTLACVPTMTIARQATGVIGGHAGQQYAPLYTNYTVQVRSVGTGKAVASKTLEQDGRFSFSNLDLNQKYLVELYRTRERALVCTEGPFALVSDARSQQTQKTDVKIECGKTPAILWLLVAGAGTASAVAISTASPSR